MAWWWWLVVQVVLWCFAGLVAVLSWLWATKSHVDLPGPAPLPLIGNLLEFRETPLTIKKIRDLHRQYGSLSRYYLGPILVLQVSHPDDIQQILLTSKLVERDPFTGFVLHTLLGDGLLSLNGQSWKVHRKLVNPTFHSELLEGFLKTFHEGGVMLSERLAAARGAATEVYPATAMAALRTICETVIGIDPDLVIPDALAEEEMSLAIYNGTMTMQRMITQPWLMNKYTVQLTAGGRSVYKYAKMLRDGAFQCIATRAAATEEGPAKSRLRLVESLVKPGGQTVIPVTEVAEEIMHVTIAGTETTAAALSFALALLALNPEWQDTAQQELREVFGEDEDFLREATLPDLNSLRVVESIIKETLRLYPVVPMLPRKATEDIWLTGGRERVLVPKGTLLAMFPFLTHRLPEFFPDPLKFDPSRFLEGHGGKEHPCSYLPFGLGARNCVGSQYARLQLKVLLTDVLRRFRILPHSQFEDLEDCVLSISQHPVRPIKVRCVPLAETSSQDSPSPH